MYTCNICNKNFEAHFNNESMRLSKMVGAKCFNCGHVFCIEHNPWNDFRLETPCPKCGKSAKTLFEGPADK